jgi:hypothetical protein
MGGKTGKASYAIRSDRGAEGVDPTIALPGASFNGSRRRRAIDQPGASVATTNFIERFE